MQNLPTAAAGERVVRRGAESLMVQECPKCGLVNPPTATRCDCGYDFASRQVVGPRLVDPSRAPVPGMGLFVGLLGFIIGVVGGSAIAVTIQLQAASQAAEEI